MLYSIEKFTMEEEKKQTTIRERSAHQSRHISTRRNFNVQTKDFKRIGVLGSGAYAEVYLVERLGKEGKRTGIFYAMKRMKKRTYNGLTRFVITEKEIQRKIDHRFVTKLYYAFQTFEYLYMITDYYPGGDMRTIINQQPNQRLTEDHARIYLAELILAIEEVHRNGIVHRDIKPENVLVDKEGHACLADFGLAKQGLFE